METQLFEAVMNGDLKRVKKLIKHGANKNEVLHFPTSWEGATLLAVAAHEGHMEIIKYLIEKAILPIDLTDPCIGRTPLHWACIADNPEVASYLLQNGADINHSDKTGVTPIIRATCCRSKRVSKLLVEQGCDVNQSDSFGSSALHYSTLYGEKELTTVFIRAGCRVNSVSTVGRETPLLNLVHNNDSYNCKLLLESGYKLANDAWVTNSSANSKDIISFVIDYYNKPLSLKSTCRLKINNFLNRDSIRKQLETLIIPTSIKQFILYEDWEREWERERERIMVWLAAIILSTCIWHHYFHERLLIAHLIYATYLDWYVIKL